MKRKDVLLSHYTDYASLEGIFRSGDLWCTSIRHLNDRSEYHYVHDMAQEQLTAAGNAAAGDLRTKLEGIGRGIAGVSTQVSKVAQEMAATGTYFVFSLSTRTNDLSQWRAYGGRGNGVELRFSRNELDRLRKPDFVLLKCDYRLAALRERLSSVVGEATTRICAIAGTGHHGDKLPGQELWQVRTWFWQQILEMAPRFKHPKFAAEQEWRMVSKPGNSGLPDSKANFRIRNGHIVPYVRFPLSAGPPTDFMGYIALREVRLGPGADVALEMATLRHMMLNRHGGHVAISSSEIPLDGR
jgi:hypothetical protein